MKKRPSDYEVILRKLKQCFDPRGFRNSLGELADRGLVAAGWQPERLDGRGKVLHISDTPSGIYSYLSRLLKRVNPSVVVHTGDLADDIKLELYPGEHERYRAAAKKLLDILQAPHRTVVITLGNHDEKALLPHPAPGCVVCEGAREMTFMGEPFRVSHYAEGLSEHPARYNLYGHCADTPSYEDEQGHCFLNGLEWIRLIDPHNGEIRHIKYPGGTNNARKMCARNLRS